VKNIVAEDTMQYVAIEKILAQLLNDPMASLLMKEHRQNIPKCGGAPIGAYSDTEYYRTHTFFSKYPDAFIINLYVDAFETTNELGSHTQVHKLEGLYMVLRNFQQNIYQN